MPYRHFIEPAIEIEEYHLPVSDGVYLKIIDFTPPHYTPDMPVVVFVAGWISLITGWTGVLSKLTPHYRTLYVETREKISAQLPERIPVKKLDFSIERIATDIHEILQQKVETDQTFYLVGSSLGSTAALDYLSRNFQQSRLAVMIAPNCEFRFPAWGLPLIRYFPAFLYTAFKPVIKWYLRTIRLDKAKEPEQVKKYEGTIDAAEPKRLQANALAISSYQLWDKLPLVAAPVVVVGAESDKLHGVAEMEKMVSLMPSARLEMMASNKETHSEKAGGFIVNEIRKTEST